MKKIIIYLLIIIASQLLYTGSLLSQSVAINTDGAVAHGSAILDIKSTTKGLLIPRMTTVQRTAIATPAKGLIVFDITTNGLWFHNGTAWNALSSGSSTNYWSATGSDIYNNTAGNVGIGTTTPINKLQIGTFSSSSITGNDIAIGNGTQAMSFYQSTTNSGWYTTNNFALLPGVGGTGNVGIGTEVPGAKLHIAGNVKIDGTNTLEFGAGIAGKEASAGKIGYQTFGAFDALDIVGAGTGANRKIKFWNEGGASFSGNVGIGVTNPGNKLQVGSMGSTGFSGNDIAVGNGTNATGFFQSNSILQVYSSTNIALMPNSGIGNIGIGTTNPANKLQIGSIGSTGFNGNDIAIGNSLNATGITQTNSNLQVYSSTNIALMPNGGTGRVGINTSTPRAPLEVIGIANAPIAGGYLYYGYLNGVGNTGTAGAPNGTIDDISIIASNRIMASEFDAISDARIKNIIGTSNAAKDLEAINNLHITDYTMKDKIKYGNKSYKKVIAQEVEKIYPQVVSKHSDFIPNVYQPTNKIEKTANGYLLSFTDKHGISSTAKKLRVLLSGTEAMQEVAIVSIPSATQVIINTPEIKVDKIFVYGEEVDDFRTVDYEGLTTLNISATQELSKLIKKQQAIIETQQQQIEQLLKRMETVEKSNPLTTTNYSIIKK